MDDVHSCNFAEFWLNLLFISRFYRLAVLLSFYIFVKNFAMLTNQFIVSYSFKLDNFFEIL